MKKIMIHRSNKDYGPYSMEEVGDLMSKGELTREDLAWAEGSQEWVPLAKLLSQDTRSAFSSAFAVPPEPGPEDKAVKTNPPMAKGLYLFGAASLVLMIAIAVAAVIRVKDTIAPFLTLMNANSGVTASFFEVTVQTNGNALSAMMTTDDSQKAQLCDRVMQEIYTLADKNPSASSLKVTIKSAGNLEVEVEIDDLDVVRKYRNKEAYAASEHRSFIGGRLVSAGLADESSLAVKPLQGGIGDLIGTTYQNQVTPPPGFGHSGFKFINESQVECLNDGVPYGAICTYTVQGDTVTVVTSCSTLVYKIKNNILACDDGEVLTRIDP